MSLMALLLDAANIVGGFLLAIALLGRLPRVGDDLGRAADRVGPFGWIVGIVALVAGGFYLIVHLTSGPRVFHFEIVGIGVGLALLWDRLTGRPRAADTGPALATESTTRTETATGTRSTTATGVALLLAIFGLIAIVVGIQGLFTPD
jgi:hypothetical protein